MKSSTDYKVSANLAVLLVGDQKTGKSCVAMAFPDPFFLDLDRNMDSAVRVAGGKTFFYDQPADENGVRVEDHLVYPRAMDMLKAAIVDPKVKTVVIDSLSTLSIFACAHILSEVSRIEGKKIEQMRIQDFGRLHGLFQKLVTFLRASGKMVVVTSHQAYDKDEMTGALNYTLSIPGQMKHNFGSFFTDVWGTSTTAIAMGKTKYEIRTRPTGRHVALGTSIRSLDAAIDITDKTPSQIWDLLAPKLSAVQVKA